MLKRPGQIGRLAQLVERFVYTEDVGGSSPSSPTIYFNDLAVFDFSTATKIPILRRASADATMASPCLPAEVLTHSGSSLPLVKMRLQADIQRNRVS